MSAGGQFSGVTNTTLTISSLATNNATNYEAVVSNASGSITSAVAALTVVPVPAYQTAILADSPISYWPMQETIGPAIHDIVSGNDGTLMTSTDGNSLGSDYHANFVTAGSASTDGANLLSRMRPAV